jgi:hypothetical protein
MDSELVRFTSHPAKEGCPVDLKMDLGQSMQRIVASLEPSHLWIVGLAAADDAPVAESQPRPYSFLADCECPDDCLRDHENE